MSLPDFDNVTEKPNDLNVIFKFLVFFLIGRGVKFGKNTTFVT